MNKNQENRLSMYVTVQQVTNFHSEVWTGFMPFKNQFNALEGIIDNIMETVSIQEGRTTGVTKHKAEVQHNVVTKAVSVSKIMFAYASVTGNLKLKDRVSYSYNELMRCRDTIIISRLKLISEAGKLFISDLEEYGLKQEDLDELSSLTASFKTIVENPRQAITNRSRATKEIKSYFAEADMIIKERLDSLMFYFRKSDPVFWLQYQEARKIVNLGRRRRKPAVESEAAA